MKLPHYSSNKLVNVNLAEYVIDWERAVSKPQKAVTDFVRPFWIADYVLSELRIPGSLFRLDIVNITKMIVIEVSPDSVHKNFNPFMHKDRAGFLKKLKADQAKIKWIETAGFQYVELTDSDIKNLSSELFQTKFDIYL